MSSIRSLVRQRLCRGGGHHHYKGYNEPGGHFLGIPPAPPGMKRKPLDFENTYVYLFGSAWVAFTIAMFYKPQSDMDAWAKQEAMVRIRERGENWDTPGRNY